MNNIKSCNECKHSVVALCSFLECHAPKNEKISLISGNVNYRWVYCISHREDIWPLNVLYRTCGRSGRWFEPKD